MATSALMEVVAGAVVAVSELVAVAGPLSPPCVMWLFFCRLASSSASLLLLQLSCLRLPLPPLRVLLVLSLLLERATGCALALAGLCGVCFVLLLPSLLFARVLCLSLLPAPALVLVPLVVRAGLEVPFLGVATLPPLLLCDVLICATVCARSSARVASSANCLSDSVALETTDAAFLHVNCFMVHFQLGWFALASRYIVVTVRHVLQLVHWIRCFTACFSVRLLPLLLRALCLSLLLLLLLLLRALCCLPLLLL